MATFMPLYEDDRQRRADARREGLNGIDAVELGDTERSLRVELFAVPPPDIQASNFTIEGGVRILGIRVLDVRVGGDDAGAENRVVLALDRSGDFSTYTLTVSGLEGFDPHYARCDFRFRTALPADFDCGNAGGGPVSANPGAAPDIDYLAKDFASFRQLIVDRLTLTAPDWTEQHIPDIGVALIDILAYVGDYLSYYQDAVATEAYLNTARQRISVRRHARLVDYTIHEGCNGRTWVCLETNADVGPVDAQGCVFITDVHAAFGAAAPVLSPAALQNVPADLYQYFVAVQAAPVTLRAAHSRIGFYAWGALRYALPAGATAATLRDAWLPEPGTEPDASARAKPGARHNAGPEAEHDTKHDPKPDPGQRIEQSMTRTRALAQLKAGDTIVIEEVLDPATGAAANADASHRQCVRLTRVTASVDPLYDQPLVEIEWAPEDALTFPLVIAALGPAPACRYLGPPRAGLASDEIFTVCANVLLIDHGLYVDEDFEASVARVGVAGRCEDEAQPAQAPVVADVFRPRLLRADPTFRVPFQDTQPAVSYLTQDPRAAQVQLNLTSIPGSPDGDTALFDFADLDDATALIARLEVARGPGHANHHAHAEQPDDRVTHALRNRLSHRTRRMLADAQPGQPPSAALRAALRADLEAMLEHWAVRPDLLASGPDDLDVSVEIDNDRRAQLRFGDGQSGKLPAAGSRFRAAYRVGNGPQAHAGAETIAHLLSDDAALGAAITRIHNPFAVQGGIAPESLADARARAPTAFRNTLARAISADDYARLAEAYPSVRRAMATLRWTGSRHVVKVAIAPYGSESPSPALLAGVGTYLETYRRIGHEVDVTAAHYVPLDLHLVVRVAPGYERGPVDMALRAAFGSGLLPGGARAFFHPDNLSFGQPIYLSAIVAVAQGLAGVASVTVKTFQRLFAAPNGELESGVLPLQPDEIAQLDNDPNFPEHGRLTLTVRGGT